MAKTCSPNSAIVYPLELKPVHDAAAKLLAAQWSISKAAAIRRCLLLVAERADEEGRK